MVAPSGASLVSEIRRLFRKGVGAATIVALRGYLDDLAELWSIKSRTTNRF